MSTTATSTSINCDLQGKWTSKLVRQTFTDYFQQKQHSFIPSSSTIPHNDPTLLFTNSGMAQFKQIFLGTVDPQSDFYDLKRACNSQKCIRAGGKHNDLEDVGRDTYHHTLFEMLGNWSFGDYFKKEAIEYAWDLLTNHYGLNKDNLYVTYFEGDAKFGLPADIEAKNLWLKVGVSEDHILPGNSKDNFWEMGPVGPCGPCSELHYDRIGGRNCANLVNKDDPDVIEIWNLVFMQYNRQDDGSLKQLPNKHIDTGMGFERLVSILQNKRSNYDTDVFSGIFSAIQRVTGKREYTGLLGEADKDGIDTAYRVIADHLRTLTFAISDGGLPSNEGRGYVLRRILRRGARYARKKFDVPIGSFFSSLVDTLVAELSPIFPELGAKVDLVKEILDEEEKSFAKTLDRGEKLFGECIKKVQKSNSKIIPGVDAWRLYDTFGFPVDLTRLMAQELGYTIDEKEFEIEQQKSKEISRQTKSVDNVQQIVLDVHILGEIEKDLKLKPTDDSFKYSSEDIQATVKAIFSTGKFVQEFGVAYEQFGLLVDKTNFYAEQGGQIYDTGNITLDDKFDFSVENCQVFGGHVLHIGHLKFGTVNVGDVPTLSFDEIRRHPIKNNHTATHMLNFALRKVVGDVVDQKGSLVVPGKLRFDYSCKSACSVEQVAQVDEIVGQMIKENKQVFYKDVPLEKAKQINGLRAVFGEVYPDPVRVVSVGIDVETMLQDPTNEKWATTSIEFCGGTHVKKTGDIRQFCVVEDQPLAKGIRRIVAVTGDDANNLYQEALVYDQRVKKLTKLDHNTLAAQLKIVAKDLDQATLPLVQKANLRNEFAKIKSDFLAADKQIKLNEINQAVEIVKEAFQDEKVKVWCGIINTTGNTKTLIQASTFIKSLGDRSAVLISLDHENNKVNHVSVVSDNFPGTLTANAWAEQLSTVVLGKSGGNKNNAQGAGTEVAKAEEALNLAREFANKCTI